MEFPADVVDEGAGLEVLAPVCATTWRASIEVTQTESSDRHAILTMFARQWILKVLRERQTAANKCEVVNEHSNAYLTLHLPTLARNSTAPDS